MKAEINKDGVLLVTAQTQTELYALLQWLKDFQYQITTISVNAEVENEKD